MPKQTKGLTILAGALILAATPALAKPGGSHPGGTMGNSAPGTMSPGPSSPDTTTSDTTSPTNGTADSTATTRSGTHSGKSTGTTTHPRSSKSATPANADGSVPADVPGPSTADANAKVLANPRATDALNSSLTKGGVTLPAGGLQEACSGFDSLGSCISALHVAQNLNLPGGFDALKALVTGDKKVPLGTAITQLQPGIDATSAVNKAQGQAQADLATANPG